LEKMISNDCDLDVAYRHILLGEHGAIHNRKAGDVAAPSVAAALDQVQFAGLA
jgi:hypothetical protein